MKVIFGETQIKIVSLHHEITPKEVYTCSAQSIVPLATAIDIGTDRWLLEFPQHQTRNFLFPIAPNRIEIVITHNKWDSSNKGSNLQSAAKWFLSFDYNVRQLQRGSCLNQYLTNLSKALTHFVPNSTNWLLELGQWNRSSRCQTQEPFSVEHGDTKSTI